MTHWLSARTWSLTALAALALSLGLPGAAHAESDATPSKKDAAPAKKGAAASKKNGHHAKHRPTAQVKKADKADKKTNGKKEHGKVTKAHGRHGSTAQAHPTAGRHADAEHPAPAATDEHADETCLRTPVELQRTSGEQLTFALTRCHGKPADKALARLSVLMRPYSVSKPGELPELPPKAGAKNLREGEIAPGIRGADAGLLSRLQAISSEYPGKSITVVSGYRPGGNGAYHRHGKALDVRVEGISNEALATFCRGLTDTGCGYYPNGEFVHFDVRSKGSGHTYWIDSAGPGEAPHYVASWPPAKDDDGKAPKADKLAPHDDTQHADVAKKPGRGSARADRDHED